MQNTNSRRSFSGNYLKFLKNPEPSLPPQNGRPDPGSAPVCLVRLSDLSFTLYGRPKRLPIFLFYFRSLIAYSPSLTILGVTSLTDKLFTLHPLREKKKRKTTKILSFQLAASALVFSLGHLHLVPCLDQINDLFPGAPSFSKQSIRKPA